jgi:hypothetical protein
MPRAVTWSSEAKVLETVPVGDRTAKMEDALGASYEQLKRTKGFHRRLSARR